MHRHKELIGVEYRPINGFPGYRIGSNGSVWTNKIPGSHYARAGKWKRRKTFTHKHGYLMVNLCHKGKYTIRTIRSLLLEAFVGPCPNGMVARHLDDNPINNALSNLCWGTWKENARDKRRNGHQALGSRQNGAVLSEFQVLEIRRRYKWYKPGCTMKSLAEEFGVHQVTVFQIVHRKTWTHI